MPTATRQGEEATKLYVEKHQGGNYPLLNEKWRGIRFQRANKFFEDAGIRGILRTSRCRILKSIAKAVKPNVHPPLANRHKIQRIEWAKRYMRPISKRSFLPTLVGQSLIARMVGPEDDWLMLPKSQQD